MELMEMLSWPFMRRALVAGILVSLCAALLGVPLVLKRYSMIGDGLANSGSRMGSDAAIAVVSASALAIGIMVISLTTGMTTDVDNYMFGSVLAMTETDVLLAAAVCAAVLALFVLFYHRLFAITFDENFARATGMRVELYNTLLSILTALTIVLGMRMMGAMLISSLVIFPALTAMRLFRSFRGVVLCAGTAAVLCFCTGLTVSYVKSTPVGATVVTANLLVFLLACVAERLRKRG